MGKQKILVVEDDVPIAELVRYNLEKAAFDCICVSDGEQAFRYLMTTAIDLIVLDIMLPQMDGFEVCKRIKQEKVLVTIPIIMLTARGEEIDKILGLELGADDYMVKPFSPRELVLRVKAILRRQLPSAETSERNVLESGNLIVDIPRHRVTVETKVVELTAMEFKLLETLMRRQGRVQSREKLLSDVWGIDAEVTTRTVDTHIKRLRQKLGVGGQVIETIRGYGYSFGE